MEQISTQKGGNAISVSNTYPVIVDYGVSVRVAVERDQYENVDWEITSFPFSGKWSRTVPYRIMPVVIEFVYPDRYVSTKEVLDEIGRKVACHPTEILELIDFGKKYPGLQREFPIAGLGSICYEGSIPCAPYLYGNRWVRSLGIVRIDKGWDPIWRFAVTRE